MPAPDLRKLYLEGLKHFDFTPTATSIIKRVIAGDDRAEDFEEAIRSDVVLTRYIINRAADALKTGQVSSLAHAVVILGKDNVRDFVLAHSMIKSFPPSSTAPRRDLKPDTAKDFIRRARQAEALAREMAVESGGIAYASGYLFDLFESWGWSTETTLSGQREILKSTWSHSLRSALIAFRIAHHPELNVVLRKSAFAAALVHKVGRLFLAWMYPAEMVAIFETLKKLQGSKSAEDINESALKRQRLGLAHTEAGSLLLFRIQVLKEFEAMVDHFDHPAVFRHRDAQMAELAQVISFASRLAQTPDTSREQQQINIDRIRNTGPFAKNFTTPELMSFISEVRARQIEE